MNRFFKTVLLTALFVGTTDILSAYVTQWISSGKFADKMLNYMAGAAIGFDVALKAGNWGAFLGLFFQYVISFAYTLFFFLLLPRVKFLRFNRYLMGMLYAVFVDVTMAQVVLPLTHMPRWTFTFASSFINWITLGVLFGIPIAYNAYKYYGVKNDNPLKTA